LPLASRGTRIGATLIELAIIFLAPVIGALAFIVWSLIVWDKGQTPGKQCLKLQVLHLGTRAPVSWGRMALRQFVYPLCVQLGALVLLGVLLTVPGANVGAPELLILYLLMLAIVAAVNVVLFAVTPLRQTIFDKMCNTVVVDQQRRSYSWDAPSSETAYKDSSKDLPPPPPPPTVF